MKIAVYGKGGIGKSTVSSNVSVALAKRGKKVLQIGCDPKHDSTFSLTGFLIPTIIDTLASKNYHYEEIWVEDIIYQGFGSVHCVESGGPPAGSGCGGYVVGETVKLLKELNAFYEYDIILFDVLGDVVCGGFAAPLNYSDYCLIVVDNGFDSIYAANRILASIHEKAKSHQIRFIGLVANKTSTVDQHLIQHYFKLCPMPLLDVIPNLDSLRLSKIEGKTIFQLANFNDQHGASLQYFSNFYLNIADEFLSQPEGVLIQEAEDKKLFHFLSTVGVDDVELGSTQSNPPITSDTELVGQSSVTSRQHVADGNVELAADAASRQKQSQNDLVFI